MDVFTIKAGVAPCTVEMALVLCGKDLSVTITGGTHPHIGASALAIPRPSLQDPRQFSASESVLCVTAHKDDLVAKQAAHRLAASFGGVVSACAGLHLDAATQSDISAMMAAFHTALEEAEATLRQRGFGAK